MKLGHKSRDLLTVEKKGKIAATKKLIRIPVKVVNPQIQAPGLLAFSFGLEEFKSESQFNLPMHDQISNW